MDNQKISQEIQKGNQARELLENPLLKEAFTTIETEITDIWKTSKTNQPELREESFHSLRALQRVQGMLQMWMDNGKIALAELEKRKK